MQSKMNDYMESEPIYHHELHQAHINNSSILKLDPTNSKSLNGHRECADFLEKTVSNLLSGEPALNARAQNVLLEEVERVVTKEDNRLLLEPPTKKEILKNLQECQFLY